jgi:hypothetical protein
MTEPDLVHAENAVADLEEQIDQRGWRRNRRSQQVREACWVPGLVAEFIRRLLTRSGDVHETLRHAVRRDPAYRKAFGSLAEISDEFGATLKAFDGTGSAEGELADRLSRLAEDLLDALDVALDAFEAAVDAKAGTNPNYARRRQEALYMANGFRKRVRLRREIRKYDRRTSELPTEQVTTSPAVRRDWYAAIEKSERRAAEALRWWAIGLFISSSLGVAAIGFTVRESDMRQALLAAAFLPILLLASHLARESAQHRTAVRWARSRAMGDGDTFGVVVHDATDGPTGDGEGPAEER